MTMKELLRKLELLEPFESEEQKKGITCQLIGHSKIQSTWFGYYYCGRCGDKLGDALGSVYTQAKEVVIIGHNCGVCRKNYEKCTWKDKFMVQDPFKEEESCT